MKVNRRPISTRPFPIALFMVLAPSAALAQVAPVVPGVITLSDAERAEVLRQRQEAGTNETLEGLVPQPSTTAPRQIHGEVGAMIGSNGARGAFGAASVPLGKSGEASVSFESSRFGHSR